MFIQDLKYNYGLWPWSGVADTRRNSSLRQLYTFGRAFAWSPAHVCYDILTCGDGTAKKIVGKVSIPQSRMTVVANAVITIQVLTLTDPEPIAMLLYATYGVYTVRRSVSQ